MEANESTGAGIVLPDLVRQKESRGIVLAVGDPYAGELEAPVKVGEVIVYAELGTSPYGQPCRVTVDRNEDGNAEELVIVSYADILLVLEEVESEVRA